MFWLYNLLYRSNPNIHFFNSICKPYLCKFSNQRIYHSDSKLVMLYLFTNSKTGNIILYYGSSCDSHSAMRTSSSKVLREPWKRNTVSRAHRFEIFFWNFFKKSTFRISNILSKIKSFSRSSQIQLVSCSRHCDIHEPSFFLQFFGLRKCSRMWEKSIL